MKRSCILFESLKTTSLNAFHKQQGAKMVPFCGWEMPVQYKLGVLGEHMACRNGAAIFDVAHMCQIVWKGKDRVKFLEHITPVSLKVPVGQAKLSVILNEEGGVIDDTIITNQEDHIFEIVNAGCADKDLAYFKQALSKFKGDVALEVQDRGLIALQGPKAASILQQLTSVDLTHFDFMTARNITVAGIPCYVTRCGYTGEDGFEVAMPNDKASTIASAFLEKGAQLAGLGARDSLRLEAGLCLYGHELDETISPIEANLQWLIVKSRREQGGFIGAQRVQNDLKNGVSRKRIGLTIQGAPARENAKVFSPEGSEIGRITSGTHSPVLRKNVAIAYVTTPFSKNGTKVNVEVRGKMQSAEVTALPFVKTNYYRAPK